MANFGILLGYPDENSTIYRDMTLKVKAKWLMEKAAEARKLKGRRSGAR